MHTGDAYHIRPPAPLAKRSCCRAAAITAGHNNQLNLASSSTLQEPSQRPLYLLDRNTVPCAGTVTTAAVQLPTTAATTARQTINVVGSSSSTLLTLANHRSDWHQSTVALRPGHKVTTAAQPLTIVAAAFHQAPYRDVLPLPLAPSWVALLC